MQDNLEFLQWTKRFWDQYFPGGEYDAIARRKGQAGPPPPSSNGPSSSSARTSAAGSSTAAARRGTTPTTGSAVRPARSGVGAAPAALSQENAQLKETVAGLERERDFYFSKLRDIELLIQNAVEVDPELEKDEEGLVKQIQGILYSTEVSWRKKKKTSERIRENFSFKKVAGLILPNRKGSRFRRMRKPRRTMRRLFERG